MSAERTLTPAWINNLSVGTTKPAPPCPFCRLWGTHRPPSALRTPSDAPPLSNTLSICCHPAWLTSRPAALPFLLSTLAYVNFPTPRPTVQASAIQSPPSLPIAQAVANCQLPSLLRLLMPSFISAMHENPFHSCPWHFSFPTRTDPQVHACCHSAPPSCL
jgi:hypothetical protein